MFAKAVTLKNDHNGTKEIFFSDVCLLYLKIIFIQHIMMDAFISRTAVI